MKIKKLGSIVLAMITAMTMGSCAKGGVPAEAGIQFIALEIGRQVYIPVDNESAWKSDDPLVTETSTTDRGYIAVTGLAAGTAYITAEGEKTRYRVTVYAPQATPFDIDNGNSVYIDFGNFDAVAATQLVINGKTAQNGEYTFESADRRIATVDANGAIHAWRKGVTVITVTQRDGAYRKINVIITGNRADDFYVSEIYSGLSGTSAHVQSSTSDGRGEVFVHSYTDRLIVQHRDGEILGTVVGLSGHSGGIAYDEERDLYYVAFMDQAGSRTSYVLIVDVNKITRIGMTPTEADMRITYIGAPIRELSQTRGYGTGPYDGIVELGGKFGIKDGVDGMTLGPIPGSNDGKRYLSFAGSVLSYSAKHLYRTEKDGQPVTIPVYTCDRDDNDYLIMMQYDLEEILSYAVPYAEKETADGPKTFANTFFFYMGVHDFGTQQFVYWEEENAYILSCYGMGNAVEVYDKQTNERLWNVDYQGTIVTGGSVSSESVAYDANKHYTTPAGVQFPYYPFYILDASKVERKELIGNNGYVGNVVSAKYGALDEATGIRGFTNYFADVGIFAVPGGYVYGNTHIRGDSTSHYTRLYKRNINENNQYSANIFDLLVRVDG